MNTRSILAEPADCCCQRAFDGAAWIKDLADEFTRRLAYHDSRGLVDDALALAAVTQIVRAVSNISWVSVEEAAQRLRDTRFRDSAGPRPPAA
jgi:hypothetical protein